MRGGAMAEPSPDDEPVVLFEYDPHWPEAFRAEEERVRAALGDEVLTIHHIGSTAIAGIAAKPVIDILVAVEVLQPLESYLTRLAPLGYRTQPSPEEGRHFFLRGQPHRTHHVHVVEHGTFQYWRHIVFRDYLRAHPDEARRYENLKRNLAQAVGHDRDSYTRSKGNYITQVTEAGLKEDPILRRKFADALGGETPPAV